jgi:2'-5' RNA ligase
MARVAREQQALDPRMRAVRADRYHLTLQFLGDYEALTEGMQASLVAAATQVAAPPAFELLLDRVGSFGAGRVVWLGCGDVPPQLERLHRQLGEALADAGMAPRVEAGFVPHVTVHRNARRPIDGRLQPLRWQVRDFVLVDSTAGEYRLLGRWP